MNEIIIEKKVKTELEIKEEKFKELRNKIDDLKDEYTQTVIEQIKKTEEKERKLKRD